MATRSLRVLAALVAALALTLALAVPAQASVIAPRAAHSPNADDIRVAYWVMLAVAAVVFVAINGALLFALVRFRERRSRRPAQVAAGRGAILRAAAPLALLAAAILAFGVIKTDDARHVATASAEPAAGASGALLAQVGLANPPSIPGVSTPPAATGVPGAGGAAPAGGPVVVNAVGQQWLWRFDYPQPGEQGPPYSTFSYNLLVVPVGTTVILNVTSVDVLHRFFVPALGGQVDAVPGQTSQTWFRADHEGVYGGQSTSYSGSGYSVMRIWVKVVSPQAYAAFLKRKKAEIAKAQGFVKQKISQQATVGGVKLP